MVKEDLIIGVYCLVDDLLKELGPMHLRQRGPQPTLSDGEVIAIEVAGELLGLEADRDIFRTFQQDYSHLFPALAHLNRTSFLRQAANLFGLTQVLHRRVLLQLGAEPDRGLFLVDSFPLPVCRLSRSRHCRRFAGLAAYGYDASSRSFFYGFRVHLRTFLDGTVAQVDLAPANVSDLAMLQDLIPAEGGQAIGDRGYRDDQHLQAWRDQGLELLAPYRHRRADPEPERSSLLLKARKLIETAIGQLTGRLHAKHTWARDLWHLCHRLVRKALSHTMAVLLNTSLGHPPLQLDRLFEA